jgi:signal transduction histidine kinase
MALMTSEAVRTRVVAERQAVVAERQAEPTGASARGARRWRTGPLAVVLALLWATSVTVTGVLLPAQTNAPPTLYAAIEVLLAVVAIAAAWLLRRGFLRTRRRADLLLAVGLLAFSAMHVVTTAVPAALNVQPRGLLTAVDVYGELLVDVVLAAAALASRVPHRVVTRHPDRLLGVLGLSVGGAAVVAGVLGSRLGFGESTAAGVGMSRPVLMALAAVAGGLLSLGAVLFTRAAVYQRDRSRLLIPLGLMILAGAPSLRLSQTVGDGYSLVADTLQMVGFGLIGMAALSWELRTRRLAVRTAALAERQRIARDLHDGLAQELAFIAAHSSRIRSDTGGEHPIICAARRALHVCRSTIAELTDSSAANVREVLDVMASELRQRYAITITLDVDLVHEPSAQLREDAARIVREAIVNAVRHGEAHTVVVSLREADGQIKLRVEDDGRGIDVVTRGIRREGFGLRSIRERAAGFGGSAQLTQSGASGSVLDVVLR